uniref:Protein IWS1 homolog n=1 Tax=Salarias fasciatus TaxID=181472 RepID=A0A672H8R1_SALFA
GSNDEDAAERPTRGADSDSEADAPEGRRHDNDDRSDSDAEAPRPRRHDDGDRSDSGSDGPRPADSDDDSPVKRRVSASKDEEEEEEEAPRKREAAPASDVEDEHEEEQERRAAAAADSDSDNRDAKPAASDRDSDSETESAPRRKEAQMDSEDEEKQDGHGEGEGGGGGGGGGKWRAVMESDSEDEEEERGKKAAAAGTPKRTRAVSDDEDSDSDGASGGPDKALAAKLRELGSDSGSEEEERAAAAKDEKALFGSDSESGDEEEKIIADIFGESGDEEEEEFTGFNQEDLEGDKQAKEQQQQPEDDSDSDEGVDRGGQDYMSDFDLMLARRKAMNSRKRRHRDGGTFISDADDVVSAMITKMTEAAEEDRTLNSQKKPALKKLTLLPQVVMHLKKQDLKETFIDSGVMSAIKEWISPLPDKSLPALRIREELLRILQELPSVSQETLKHSGIGRAVMFLYKHPKESRTNKDLALKLINEWSRPIFGLTSNYKGMTREERQQRDLDQQMPQRRRLSSGGQTPRRDLEKQLTGEEKALRPGDPGFCARARVPMPSNKDYVVRPKWNVEGDSSRGPVKKGLSRVDKQMRRFADIRRLTKTGHAVKISVEGNRMPL